MLYGTNAWQVNNSYARGFFAACCACGTNHRIEMRPIVEEQILDEHTTRPYSMCVIIECKECGQVVHVLTDGSSHIVKDSDRITDVSK
jgi:hypothetical protein